MCQTFLLRERERLGQIFINTCPNDPLNQPRWRRYLLFLWLFKTKMRNHELKFNLYTHPINLPARISTKTVPWTSFVMWDTETVDHSPVMSLNVNHLTSTMSQGKEKTERHSQCNASLECEFELWRDDELKRDPDSAWLCEENVTLIPKSWRRRAQHPRYLPWQRCVRPRLASSLAFNNTSLFYCTQ